MQGSVRKKTVFLQVYALVSYKKKTSKKKTHSLPKMPGPRARPRRGDILPIEIAFRTPACIIVSGPSCSGKTFFLKKLLSEKENLRKLFKKPVTRIVWYYKIWQPDYEELQRKNPVIEFYQNVLKEGISKHFPDPHPQDSIGIVVLDDLMKEGSGDSKVLDIFTKESHHLNITCFMILQNIFFQGKYSVNIKRNATYIILFLNCCNRRSRKNLLLEIFDKKHAAKVDMWLQKLGDNRPYSSVLIDYHTLTNGRHRIRANILDRVIRLGYA